MKIRTCLLISLALLTMAGCASGPDGTIAGTRMDLRDFSALKVGMLPVTVNPNFDAKDLPLRDLQKHIADAIRTATPLTTVESIADIASAPFPATPTQLAKRMGEISGYDAVVGASVIAWNPSTNGHRARASIMISFVDLKATHRKWVVSGTWKAFGADQLPSTIGSALEQELKGLNDWLTKGLIPLFGRQASADDPIVTYYSPSTETGRATSDKAFPLVISGIDDEGLTNISIRNAAADFTWSAAKEVLNRTPIYVSTSVQVPLMKGRNRVLISATNTRGRQIEHAIALTSTSPRGTHLLAVGVAKLSASQQADDADNAVRAIERAAKEIGLPGVHMLQNRDATSDKVNDTMRGMRDEMGPGDEVVLILTGRGNLSQRQPYLQLAVAPDQPSTDQKSQFAISSYSSFHRLTLQDIEPLTQGYPALVVLDLCTEAAAVDYLREQLQGALTTLPQRPANSLTRIVADVSDCNNGVGKITKRLAKYFDMADRPEQLSVESLFATVSGERRVMLRRLSTAPQPAEAPEEKLLAWNGKDSGTKDYWSKMQQKAPPQTAAQQAPPPPQKAAPPPPAAAHAAIPQAVVQQAAPEFWAVVTSTLDKDVAMARAEGMKRTFPKSTVVLGTNGVFNVTLGSFPTADEAYGALKKADGPTLSAADGSVLAPEGVKSTVTQ